MRSPDTPRWLAAVVVTAAAIGCAAGALPPADPSANSAPSAPPDVGTQRGSASPIAPAADSQARASPIPDAASGDDPGDLSRLPLDAEKIALPAGRSLVEVTLPPDRFVSIAVQGPPYALLGFDVIDVKGPPSMRAVRSRSALDEDGILPRIISLRGAPGATSVTVLVDVTDPVELGRVASAPTSDPPLLTPKGLPQGPPLPLIGLPAPLSRDDGYVLQSPSRYQFMRVDAALTLLAALRASRIRFRRDPIAIADISQWDGLRPATDLGRPRHISHEGGRDVDIALPADDGGPSTVRPHCESVLVEADVQGCAPGTVQGFDALRSAFLLGLLLDAAPRGRVERIFTDDAYIREMRRAAEVLRARRWIKEEGFAGLLRDDLVRPSPWHVDHIHIRFAGPPGRAPFAASTLNRAMPCASACKGP